MTTFDYGTVPGLAPDDPSVAADGSWTGESPVPLDGQTTTTTMKGQKPFSAPSTDAVPVVERSPSDWRGNQRTVTEGIRLIDRTRGRKQVTIWVAASETDGVLIAPNAASLDQGVSLPIPPGASLDIFSEAPIWIAPASGSSSATFCWVEYFRSDLV
jgi:hypothetical protein